MLEKESKMKDLCAMCGERKSEEELCRTENRNDRWRVCLECASIMLEDPNLAGKWQRVGEGRAEAGGFGCFSSLALGGPRSLLSS